MLIPKARGPRRGALGLGVGRSCTVWLSCMDQAQYSVQLVEGPRTEKTAKRQLSPGNTDIGSKVRVLLPDRALVIGSRSKGPGKMVQEPRAKFHVAR